MLLLPHIENNINNPTLIARKKRRDRIIERMKKSKGCHSLKDTEEFQEATENLNDWESMLRNPSKGIQTTY